MSYYRFVNVTKNVDDYAGKTNIQNIGLLSLFESVIYTNRWNYKDIIMAFPEVKSNVIIIYVGGDLEMKMECDLEIECDYKASNCNICDEKLVNHDYGNVCIKHIPSYALWDEDSKELEDSEEFYEELSERKLANELDDYNQDYNNYGYGEDNYGYDAYGDYECECVEESFY